MWRGSKHRYGNEGDQEMERKDSDSPNRRTSRKGSSTVSTPESFTFETRFVVLNFLSFNPHRSPPSHICTPSSTSESDHLLASRYVCNNSLPDTPSRSHPSIRKLRKGNTMMELGIAANRHMNLPNPRSDISQDHNHYPRQRRHTLHHQDYRHLQEVKEEDGFHTISSLEDRSGGQSVDSAMKMTYVKQVYSTDEPKFHLATQLQHHSSIETSEGSSLRDCHTELSYHSDADDEYEESNSSTMFKSLNAHRTSLTELDLSLPLQKDSNFLKPDIEDDTPKTGVFSPNLDLADTAFAFESQVVEKDVTLNHGNKVVEEESHLQEVNSILIGDNNETVVSHISMVSANTVMDESETEITCRVVDPADIIPSFSSEHMSESEDCLTSSISLGEQSDDVVPTASSSHDVEGMCCRTHARPLDRSKLRLEIKDNFRADCPCPDYEVDSIVESMKAELEEEMSCLESEVADAIRHKRISPVYSPFLIPLTPQSEAAKILARIGDEVKDKYENKLETAMTELFYSENATITYNRFKDVAKDVVDENLPGWRQVALLLVYGQRAAWRAVESGHHGIGDLVDNTARLLAESAAGFIIQQGGWGAVMNYDLSQSSSNNTPESLKDIMSPWQSDLNVGTPHTNSEEQSQIPESKLTETFTYQRTSTNLDQSNDLFRVHSINTHQSCSQLAHQIDISSQSNSLNISANNNHKCPGDLINPMYQYFADDVEQSPENFPFMPPGWSVDEDDDDDNVNHGGIWKDITEFYFSVVMVCSIALFVSFTSKR